MTWPLWLAELPCYSWLQRFAARFLTKQELATGGSGREVWRKTRKQPHAIP
jgi:hypothetical protein